MTDKEKARAYDRALNTARSWYTDAKLEFKKPLETLFPELKESEDEKTRKNLIGYINGISENEVCKETKDSWIAWLEKQGDKCLVNFDEAEKEKYDFVSEQYIECRASFNEFKEGNSYWFEYVGDDTYIGRSDNILNQKFHITPRQLYRLFTQQHFYKEDNTNNETNAPTGYGKYVDKCLNEASKHFFSEGEDAYSVADLFYAGVRCGKSWLEKQGTPAKLSEEEQNKFAKGVLRRCAISFIDYLDEHKYEGKMCVSNGECEDIEEAFHSSMWDKLHRYYCKYTEKQEPVPEMRSPEEPNDEDLPGSPGSSTDNPKPRFKAGQTIVNIYHNPDTDSGTGKIKEVTDDKYIFEGGSYIKISEQDHWKLNLVNPKFKPGEWIAHDEANFVFKVISIGPNTYEVINPDGYTKSISFKHEGDYHPWTIYEAKENDVIVEDKIPDHSSPFIAIFKEMGPHGDTFSSHCFIDFNGSFNEGSVGHDPSNLHPATKEQRDLLFRKMNEAGYEWDADKKELKKIEQKPAWSEEDENNINSIVSRLEIDISYWESRSKTRTNEDKKLVGWLKSLRPRKQWKPSNEQIESFEHFVKSIGESGYASPYENNTKLLYSLLNDLKKLKE